MLKKEITNFKNIDIEKKDEPEWKLQIEPTTGKFTAPPKEYLLNMLKTKNISDIAKTFAISANPVSKWLKQYEIKIKEYHNYDS
jgi:abortive infection bacteriophage resistance protein